MQLFWVHPVVPKREKEKGIRLGHHREFCTVETQALATVLFVLFESKLSRTVTAAAGVTLAARKAPPAHPAGAHVQHGNSFCLHHTMFRGPSLNFSP